MFAQHPTKLIVAIVTCVAAFAAAGAAPARVPVDPVAVSPTAPLYNRVLTLELQGFTSTMCPVAVTSPAQWAQHSLPEDELRTNGFVNGLREPLRSSNSTATVYSVVAQFDSRTGALAEADAELQQARASSDEFTVSRVPSVPGGYAYTFSTNGTKHIDVGFAEGRFQYLLAIDGAGRTEETTLRARLAAAAAALYRRGQTR
jgi:hypothetical protein